MARGADQKLFLGGRLKRLRRDLGLTQTAMAADLSVSPSYLNHVERNQRPVSAQLLLRLAETYDVDLRGLGQVGAATAEQVAEVFADPLFSGLQVPRHEVLALAEEALLINEPEDALRQAKLALTELKSGSPAHVRASDLIMLAQKQVDDDKNL